MPKGKHRQPVNWRSRYMIGITTIAALVITACAAMVPTPTQAQESFKPADWKPMAVLGLEYACDPVLGVIVKHEWWQTGAGGDSYKNWSISVTPYSQLNIGQRQQMCEARR